VSGPLTARHFELYRLMWAKSWPGKGGRPVCKWGQAKLGAWLDSPMSDRQVRRLVADLSAAGLVDKERQPSGGGYKGRGRGGNWNVLTVDLTQLAHLESAQVPWTGHGGPGQDMAEQAISAGALDRTRAGMSSTRYVRSTSGTGGALTHPESGPAEPSEGAPLALVEASALQPSQPTNNGRRGWIPREEYVRRKARQIAATDGVVKAEAYLAKCQATQERQERMRAAGRNAQAVQAAEDPAGTQPAVGGYGTWLPAWAAEGPPQLDPPPATTEVLGTSRVADPERDPAS
jgi:hypothetical protein